MVPFKKTHVLVYETLKFHKWFFPPPLSLSQILKECPFSVNMSTHIPTFLLLFIVWTLSTSTATNTTARPKNPSAPLQLNAAMASCRWLSTMRRLRRCCAVRNGGRFRPPCCHSLTPPLLVKRWDKGRNLKWFYLDPPDLNALRHVTWLKRDDFQVICSIEDKSLFDVWEYA